MTAYVLPKSVISTVAWDGPGGISKQTKAFKTSIFFLWILVYIYIYISAYVPYYILKSDDKDIHFSFLFIWHVGIQGFFHFFSQNHNFDFFQKKKKKSCQLNKIYLIKI